VHLSLIIIIVVVIIIIIIIIVIIIIIIHKYTYQGQDTKPNLTYTYRLLGHTPIDDVLRICVWKDPWLRDQGGAHMTNPLFVFMG